MKNECLWGVDIEFKILMRKVKSLLKQTTPLQICSAPFLNSPEQYNSNPAGWEAVETEVTEGLPLRQVLRRVKRGERSSGMRGESAGGLSPASVPTEPSMEGGLPFQNGTVEPQ